MSSEPATLALVGPDVIAGDGWEAPVVTAGPLTATDLAPVRAEHLVLCPAGVSLVPEAPGVLREMLLHDPEVDLAYFDGFATAGPGPSGRSGRSPGVLDGKGVDERAEAHLRPGFSPERLRAQMYLGPALMIRRRVVEAHLAAGLDLDLIPTLDQANRLAARCRVVAHVPRLLYGVDPTVFGARSAMLDVDSEHARLKAERFPAKVALRVDDRSTIDLLPSLEGHPPVSIVMPTRGGERELDGRSVTLCLAAVDQLVGRTTYRPYELVLVLTPGAPEDLAHRISSVVEAHDRDRRPAVRFCRDERPFNFSNACNRGASYGSGEVLVFLNDDTAVRSADWLQRLVMYATRPDIGAVGARLLYGDGTIQHAGLWSRGGHPAHRYEGFPADHRGHLDALTVPQNCLAVTGACLAVETTKFGLVGGFCPEFPSSYNDVDLCLKLAELGYRTVVDPGVVLDHYEASTRDPGIEDWELALLHRRWRRVLIDDPFDNPNHLAPQSDEYPAPDPTIALLGQRAADTHGVGGPLPRLWRRPETALLADRTQSSHPEVDRHVV